MPGSREVFPSTVHYIFLILSICHLISISHVDFTTQLHPSRNKAQFIPPTRHLTSSATLIRSPINNYVRRPIHGHNILSSNGMTSRGLILPCRILMSSRMLFLPLYIKRMNILHDIGNTLMSIMMFHPPLPIIHYTPNGKSTISITLGPFRLDICLVTLNRPHRIGLPINCVRYLSFNPLSRYQISNFHLIYLIMRIRAHRHTRQRFILTYHQLLMLIIRRHMVGFKQRDTHANFRGHGLILFQQIVIMDGQLHLSATHYGYYGHRRWRDSIRVGFQLFVVLRLFVSCDRAFFRLPLLSWVLMFVPSSFLSLQRVYLIFFGTGAFSVHVSANGYNTRTPQDGVGSDVSFLYMYFCRVLRWYGQLLISVGHFTFQFHYFRMCRAS